jgi:hypothetical protein
VLVIEPAPSFAQRSAGSLIDVGAADGGDAKLLTLGVGHAEKPGQPIGSALLTHVVGLLQYRYGLGLSEGATHALGCQLQRADRITNILVVVPAPSDKPSPQVLGVCGANMQRVPLDLATANSGQAEGTSLAALRLHAVARAFAYAMLRERTQLSTSREGSIGGVY